MSTLDLIFGAAVLAVPILLGAAWWRWSRQDRSVSPQWRQTAFFVSLLAASINGALLYGWLAYGFMFTRTSAYWATKDALGNRAGIYLAAASLAGAAAGKSRGRILVALAALFQLIMWSNVGIL